MIGLYIYIFSKQKMTQSIETIVASGRGIISLTEDGFTSDNEIKKVSVEGSKLYIDLFFDQTIKTGLNKEKKIMLPENFDELGGFGNEKEGEEATPQKEWKSNNIRFDVSSVIIGGKIKLVMESNMLHVKFKVIAAGQSSFTSVEKKETKSSYKEIFFDLGNQASADMFFDCSLLWAYLSGGSCLFLDGKCHSASVTALGRSSVIGQEILLGAIITQGQSSVKVKGNESQIRATSLNQSTITINK